MQFVIPTKRVAIVRCEGSQLRRRRVLNPLISRPRSLVDPFSLLSDPNVAIAGAAGQLADEPADLRSIGHRRLERPLNCTSVVLGAGYGERTLELGRQTVEVEAEAALLPPLKAGVGIIRHDSPPPSESDPC